MWSVDALDALVEREVKGSERLEAALLAFARVRGLTFEEPAASAEGEGDLKRLLPLVVAELSVIETGRDGLVDSLKDYAAQRGLMRSVPAVGLSALDVANLQNHGLGDEERDDDVR